METADIFNILLYLLSFVLFAVIPFLALRSVFILMNQISVIRLVFFYGMILDHIDYTDYFDLFMFSYDQQFWRIWEWGKLSAVKPQYRKLLSNYA